MFLVQSHFLINLDVLLGYSFKLLEVTRIEENCLWFTLFIRYTLFIYS